MSAQSSPSAFSRYIVRQYEVPRGMVSRLAEDFSAEEATTAIGNHKPLVWFLGHVAQTDDYFLTLYGGAESVISAEHAKLFGRGSDGHGDFTKCSKDELTEILSKLHDGVTAVLSSLSPDDLDRPADREVQHAAFKTLGTALTILVAHCGYHAGQIGDLRRALGKDPLFG